MKHLTFLAIFLVSLGLTTYAHEGHDKTPGAVAAPHGGIMQDLEHIFLELTVESNDLKIYPYDHDLKPIALKDLKLEGSATLPKKKAQKISFSQSNDAFTAKFDATGASHYALEVVVTHQGKKEKAKFNVEPQ